MKRISAKYYRRMKIDKLLDVFTTKELEEVYDHLANEYGRLNE